MKPLFPILLCLAAALKADGQEVIASARLQIVNATCLPALSLWINGAEVYPTFLQGQQTGDAPLELSQADYEAHDPRTGHSWKSKRITYSPSSAQTLVLLGDAPQSGESADPNGKNPLSGVSFLVVPHTAGTSEKPGRLRVINGLPGQDVFFPEADGKMRAVAPGAMETFHGQPSVFTHLARVHDEEIPILMRQDETPRHAIILFFLRDGRPDFIRVFENP